MGTVNWFLGTHFEWSSHQDGALSCLLSQEAYAQNIENSDTMWEMRGRPERGMGHGGLAGVARSGRVFVASQVRQPTRDW